MKMEKWRLMKTARQLRYREAVENREAADIERQQKSRDSDE